MIQYSWGTTPDSVIREQLPERFDMILNAPDREAVMLSLKTSRTRAAEDAYNQLFYEGHTVSFDKRKMLALLAALKFVAFSPRRKYAERAASLRSNILEVIGIEEM